MPALTATPNECAPVRAMDEGVLDLLTRTTDFDHGYIRLDRTRRKQ